MVTLMLYNYISGWYHLKAGLKTSRAAAWDCPVSIHANLGKFDSHSRTSDNFEVFRRWEQVMAQNWLSEEQKHMLKNLDQEHILLINEQKEFELLSYEQIDEVANGSREIRAFVFDKDDCPYVIYWHISGSGKLELPLSPENVKLFETLGHEIDIISAGDKSVIVPLNNRRFIKSCGITKEQLTDAFISAIKLEL